MSATKINPAYFGPAPIHISVSATAEVFDVDPNRNLAMYQFDIFAQTGRRRPNGYDGFYTFRNGFSGINTANNAPG